MAGHAELLREAVDGLVGEDLSGWLAPQDRADQPRTSERWYSRRLHATVPSAAEHPRGRSDATARRGGVSLCRRLPGVLVTRMAAARIAANLARSGHLPRPG